MNIYVYAWGILGFLAGTQISERNPLIGVLFALAAIICLVIGISKDKE
jgi:tetrahydromethanopterin S-methyltransferase subunit C